jgi:hypothetical protein
MKPNLFTNRINERDFISDALDYYAQQNSFIFIASAFFTDDSLIQKVVANKGRVRLIVRLNEPTSPKALKRIIDHPEVEIRYYTVMPKLKLDFSII